MRPPLLEPEQRETLAGLFHADRAKSFARLELLELRLLKFFQWERAADPEERAARVLERMVNRIHEGAEVLDPEEFALDLARAELVTSARVEAEAPARLRPASAHAADWAARLPAGDLALLARWFPPSLDKRRNAREEWEAAPRRLYPSVCRALDLRERCEDAARSDQG